MLTCDLHFVACVLRAAPLAIQGKMAQTIIIMADVGDRHRKRLGRAHPQFGAGTLTAAAQHFGAAQPPDFCDSAYVESLAILTKALVQHRHHFT